MRKRFPNLILIIYLLKFLLYIIFNMSKDTAIVFKVFYLLRKHAPEFHVLTFVFTSHPLNRPSVIIMLTNRKCKHADLRKVKQMGSKFN